MEENIIKVKITFTEGVLGTLSANKELYSEYIASKAPDDETREREIEEFNVEEETKKSLTVFARDENGAPALFDYQVKGFFKEACGIVKKLDDTASSKITAHKKLVDNIVFIKERYIPININGKMGICERPLRAQTAQGERIALAMSEEIPASSTAEFTVQLLSRGDKKVGKEGYIKALMEWLEYGKYKGIGQWRNSSKGRFTYEIIE